MIGSEVGSAYIRLRPNLSTFRSETQTGVRSALGGVAKTIAGIAGVAGGIRFFESAVKDAAEEQRALDSLHHSVISVGAAYTLNGRSLDEILQKMEVATGVGVPELAQGFLRLVTQTKSSRTALRDLGLAEDVALSRHLRLAQSAVVLARAEGGSATALRRLGIIIPAVTAHSAALTREHERAKAAGVKFTASQELAYKAALAQSGALDKQATKTRIISEIQRRFGGQTEVFAKTAEGEAARFHESVRNILEDVGNVLLPGLSSGAERADALVERLRDSHGFDHTLSAGFHAIGQAGHVAAEGIALVAPVLTVAAHAAADVLSFTGTGGLLAFAAGWKAVGVGTSVAAGAERRYQAVLAAGRGQRAAQVSQEEAAATAQAAHTAALVAHTEALVANRIALTSRVLAGAGYAGQTVAGVAAANAFTAATEREAAALIANRAALIANAAAAEAFAISRVSAGGVLLPSAAVGLAGDAAAMARTEAAAGSLAARLGILGRGLVSLGGGWTTVAALGVGALAFGIYKLVTAESGLERANRHLGESFGDLAAGIKRAQKLRRDYEETVSTLKTDRIAVQTARTNVALAEQELRTTHASRSSLQYRQLIDQLTTAQDSYRVAVQTLGRDEAQASQQRKDIGFNDEANEKRRTKALQDTVAAAREAREQESLRQHPIAGRSAGFVRPLDEQTREERARRINIEAARDFADSRDKEAASVARTNAPLARRIKLLADFARAADRLPAKREVEVAINAPDFRAAVGALVGELGRIKSKTVTVSFRTQELHGGITEGALGASKAEDKALRGIAETSRQAAGLVEDVSRTEINEARNTVAAAKGTLSKLNQQIADERRGVSDARDAVKGTEQELADSNRGVREAGREVRDAQQGVADAIRQGAQAVRDAVAQADQNLFSIGSSLSDVIDKFLDAQKDSAAALTGPEARRLKELRAQILAGQGGPETRKAAQELAAELEARQAKGGDLDKRKERIRREIADLIDEFNKGEISLRTFNRRVAKLLEREHVSYRAAGKVLGEAFADGFRAEVRGLLAQAKALASSRRPGVTGLEPTIVRPLEAIKQSQKEIAAAQQRRDDASYALAQAGRRVQDAQERHEQAIESEGRAEHKLVSLIERRDRVVSVERRAEERLQSLQEQHLRFIRQQGAEANRHLRAIQAAAEHRPPPRAAAAPGRGGPDRPGFAAGGVAGTHGPPPGGRDTVPAWLTPKEVVFADRHQSVLARALGVRNDPHVIFRAVDRAARGVAGPEGPTRAFASGGVAAAGAREVSPARYFLHTSVGARPAIPLRRDNDAWFEGFVGQGLSRSQVTDVKTWWHEHGPMIVAGVAPTLRFAAGGVATSALYRESTFDRESLRERLARESSRSEVERTRERERGGSVREELRQFGSSRSTLERVLAERAVKAPEALRVTLGLPDAPRPSVAIAGLLGASAATLAAGGAQGGVPAYGGGGVVAEIPDWRWHARDAVYAEGGVIEGGIDKVLRVPELVRRVERQLEQVRRADSRTLDVRGVESILERVSSTDASRVSEETVRELTLASEQLRQGGIVRQLGSLPGHSFARGGVARRADLTSDRFESESREARIERLVRESARLESTTHERGSVEALREFIRGRTLARGPERASEADPASPILRHVLGPSVAAGGVLGASTSTLAAVAAAGGDKVAISRHLAALGVSGPSRVDVAAFGDGYQGLVERPTVALLAERGPEYLSVTPKSRARLVEPLDLAPLDAGRPQPSLRPAGGDRRVVGELQDLAEMEERLANKLLAESRRQTAELRRIHETQQRTTPPGPRPLSPTRPGNEASRKARQAALIG